jgi:hypothetical protein
VAAPTLVRVESNSTTQAIIRWSYSGANSIAVYRAPHGGSFTEITSPTGSPARVAPGTTEFDDNTAVAGTFYDYKLSDDSGSTFSSVVSVVIQVCVPASGSTQSSTGPALPQFTGEAAITAENLTQLSHMVEIGLSLSLAPPGFCTICPTNGAVVLDCTSGCSNFFIVATTDINSISTVGCAQTGNISIIVPANTTRRIAGFAAGSSLATVSGAFPITAGATPKQVEVSHGCKCDSRIYGQAYIVYTAAGVPCVCDDRADGSDDPSNSGATGALGGTAGCTPSGGLTLAGFKADGTTPNPTYSMGCQDANKGLKLQACGGQGPYTYSFTGSINFVGASNGRATVLPPTNNGASVGGTAYTKAICGISEAHSVGTTHNGGGTWAQYGCDDSFTSCSTILGGTVDTVAFITSTAGANCTDHSGHPITNCVSVTVTCGCGGAAGSECVTAQSCGAYQDRRSGGMISAGCNPCGTSNGSTVTVTDAFGTSVTIVIKP